MGIGCSNILSLSSLSSKLKSRSKISREFIVAGRGMLTQEGSRLPQLTKNQVFISTLSVEDSADFEFMDDHLYIFYII